MMTTSLPFETGFFVLKTNVNDTRLTDKVRGPGESLDLKDDLIINAISSSL